MNHRVTMPQRGFASLSGGETRSGFRAGFSYRFLAGCEIELPGPPGRANGTKIAELAR
jgi:hypothetical protein